MSVFRLGGFWTDTGHLRKWLVVSRISVFFCLKDLVHTTKCQSTLLSEQAQLQKDISKWTARLESCQKEAETKEQQLQELQDEIRESRLQLDQQDTVLYSEWSSFTSWGSVPPTSHPDQTAHVHLLCDSG